VLNPDADVLDRVIKGLARNEEKFGQRYCPCRLRSRDEEKDKAIICPCIYHKDEIAKDGHCHCMLYYRKDARGTVEGRERMTYALVTCSGISNTGKLTTQAGMLLMQRKPGMFLCMNCKQSAETLRIDAGGAERLIVLDGCTDCCATKKLTAAGLVPDVHIIATELGIEKNGMADVKYDEIETVIRAVMTKGSNAP
jgi:ferredoxin-thioredoxin reductase catalytic subunit